MIFLQPWWWLLGLLSLPLVLWHARHREIVQVPSLRIWRVAAPEVFRSRDVRRFQWRLDLSLWMQLLALFLLTLALAGPRPADRAFDHQVWLVDASASMEAPHAEGTRFEAATEQALRALASADSASRGGPRHTLVAVGATIEVPVVRSDRPSMVKRGLRATTLDVAQGPVNLSRLRSTLRGLVVPGERTVLTAFTDGAGASAIRQASKPWRESREVEMRVASFGETEATRGFGSVRAVPLEPEEGSWRIEGTVISRPPVPEPIEIDVTFEREGMEGVLPWEESTLQGGSSETPFSLDIQVPGPGIAALHLPADAMPGDDVAHVGLRNEPVPMRVLIAGEVSATFVDALKALPGARVDRFEAVTSRPDAPEHDLAIVGPGVDVPSRPATIVLWLPDRQADRDTTNATVRPGAPWAGMGGAGFSPIEDMPESALDDVQVLPAVDGASVLLQSSAGPLLQVETDGTDVRAGWPLGETEWAREIGFARFVTELAVAAQPRYGAWTLERCDPDGPCHAAPAGGGEERELGVHEAQGRRWIVDVAAGPEADLTTDVAPLEAPSQVPTAWHRLDSILSLTAALLLLADAARWWHRRRASSREPSIRRAGPLVARLAAIAALLALATGAPTWSIRLTEKVALVVDPTPWLHGGVPDEVRSALDHAVAEADVVVWALGPGHVTQRARGIADAPTDIGNGYDFGANLHLGQSALGVSGGRIVLAGLRGDDSSLPPDWLERLQASGVALDVMPPPAVPADEAWISISAPSSVRAGDTLTVRANVGGPASWAHVASASVDGDFLATRVDETFTWEATEPGLHAIEARLMPADVVGAAGSVGAAGAEMNDSTRAYVAVEPAASVAVVAAEGAAAEAFTTLLEDHHFDVRTWLPEDVPTSLEGFLGIDVVCLLDVPAVDLHPSRQQSLERWVREHGGGVLLAGATKAYGPGGYLRTPIEDLSPLSARVPGEQPQAAVAFVLDRSGSMQQTVEGTSRLAFTKRATVEAVDLLHPASKVAVVVFDDAAHLLKPLGSPGDVAARLAPVTAGGGTNLYPALQAALGQLRSTRAEAKHMIVMTDGLAQAAPFEPLLERITAADITISTVAVGRGADVELLQQVARAGGGAFHRSADVRALPSILSQEAMLLSSNPVREGAVSVSLEGTDAAFLEGLPSDFPELQGYVRTTPKPEAVVHASVDGGDPVLASWRHGLGRAVALATPLTGAWAGAWIGTAFADTLLAQGVRWTAAPVLAPGLALDVLRRGDALILVARLVDDRGEPREGVRLFAQAKDPTGVLVGPLALQEISRGTYAGRLDAFTPGSYVVTVEAPAGAAEAAVTAERTVHVPHPARLGFGATRATAGLAAAEATGGRLLLSGGQPLAPRSLAVDATERRGPWAWLAIVCSAAALLLDARGSRRSGRTAGRRLWGFTRVRQDRPSTEHAD